MPLVTHTVCCALLAVCVAVHTVVASVKVAADFCPSVSMQQQFAATEVLRSYDRQEKIKAVDIDDMNHDKAATQVMLELLLAALSPPTFEQGVCSDQAAGMGSVIVPAAAGAAAPVAAGKAAPSSSAAAAAPAGKAATVAAAAAAPAGEAVAVAVAAAAAGEADAAAALAGEAVTAATAGGAAPADEAAAAALEAAADAALAPGAVATGSSSARYRSLKRKRRLMRKAARIRDDPAAAATTPVTAPATAPAAVAASAGGAAPLVLPAVLPAVPLAPRMCCDGTRPYYRHLPFSHKSARACACAPCQALAAQYAGVQQGGSTASAGWHLLLQACKKKQ